MRPQKLAQLDSPALNELLDVCLMWVWLLPRLNTLLGNSTALDKMTQMWNSGTVRLKPVTILACLPPLCAFRHIL